MFALCSNFVLIWNKTGTKEVQTPHGVIIIIMFSVSILGVILKITIDTPFFFLYTSCKNNPRRGLYEN